MGFVIEQALSGIVQGGVGKIATLLLKGGVKLGATALKRCAFSTATHAHALKQYLAGLITHGEMAFVREGISNAAKKPVSTALRTPAADQVEKHLSKQFINRGTWNLKRIRDVIASSPNLKRLCAREAGEEILWQRLALFTHLMGDLADETLMHNFLKVMDKKLIYDVGGQPVDWADDFLRCFRRNPAEFVNRKDFAELPVEGKSFLKQLLSESDVGNVWKYPENDTVEWWKKFWIRGTITELEMWHKKYLKDGFVHIPIEKIGWPKAVDYLKQADKIAVQLKTTKSASSDAIQRMRTAINEMSKPNNLPDDFTMKLEVLMEPGSGVSTMRSALEAHIATLEESVGDRILLDIREHTFKVAQ